MTAKLRWSLAHKYIRETLSLRSCSVDHGSELPLLESVDDPRIGIRWELFYDTHPHPFKALSLIERV